MYKYKVQVKKVSGRLNESVLPSKSLVVKSKTKKSKNAILAEASKYFKNNYGLVIESAGISNGSSNPIIEPLINFIKTCDTMRLRECTRSNLNRQQILRGVTNKLNKLYTTAAKGIERDARQEWEEAQEEGLGIDYIIEEWAEYAPGEVAANYVDLDWITAINNFCAVAKIEFDESYVDSMSLGQAFITLILTTDIDNEWSLEMAKNIVLAHEGDIFR